MSSVVSPPSSGRPQPSWPTLSPPERRVLGVLVEKAKTTPDAYPLTLAALTTGCNQKTNRIPLTNYDQDEVEETLDRLRARGLVIQVDSSTGRVPRFKHTLYEKLGVTSPQLAVIAELLLRGPQTEGDLRARANRMLERDPIADLTELQTLLAGLIERGLVVSLSPEGQKRGVVVTHGLYPPDEWERVRLQATRDFPAEPSPSTPTPTQTAPAYISTAPPHPSVTPVLAGSADPTELAEARREIAVLRAQLETLRAEVARLQAEFAALKTALGA